ncbi:MAG: heavy metal-responsive transcriptional regulator [Ignavibacteriae bacterium]|nr:heavy metal-responsive transcriptional regulator [Ignavibacteriota bacterium]
MENLKVGEIAKKVGVNIETLRYYEKIKLMPKPRRIESKYRMYDILDVQRLLFIKKAKELGFTLKEIKELLELKIESSATCGDVKIIAKHKIRDIENKITDLQKIKKILQKLVSQCVTEEISKDECPILETIVVK